MVRVKGLLRLRDHRVRRGEIWQSVDWFVADQMDRANTRRSPNVELMLAHRLRRWASIAPALDERLV